jgi:hypothetical protein
MSQTDSQAIEREEVFNSPQESFLGVMEEQSQVETFRKELFNLGVQPKALSILKDTQSLQVKDGENLPRKLLAYDEVDTEKRFKAALKEGKRVIAIKVSEDQKELRDNIAKAFYAAKGTFLTYFGTLTFEQIPKPQ